MVTEDQYNLVAEGLDCMERAELTRLRAVNRIQEAQIGHMRNIMVMYLKNPIGKNKFKVADYLKVNIC